MRVTVAVPVFVLSATLVAVTVTLCAEATDAGALYKPVGEIDPTPEGVMDQVTAVLLLFVTVAANCWVWESNRLLVAGVTLTATGFNVTVAEADLVGSVTLVAITLTVCTLGIRLGAVYSPPAETEPTPDGEIDQVTPVPKPDRAAPNCWLCDAYRAAVAGATLMAR